MPEQTKPNETAAPGSGAGFSIGKVMAPDFLWAALQAVSDADSVRNGVLIVFTQEMRGRIGIFCNRYISGAIVDDTGQKGAQALESLMSVRTGMFGFRACLAAEGQELKQDLAVDITEMLLSRTDHGTKDFTPEAAVAEVSSTRLASMAGAVFSDDPDQDSMESLGASGTFFSERADAPAAEKVAPEVAAPAESTTAERTDADQPLSYLDWSADPKSIPTGRKLPKFSQILTPVFRPSSNQDGRSADDLKTYRKMVEEESNKLTQQIEQSQSSEEALSQTKSNFMQDLQLFQDMLKSENDLVQNWMSSDLDSIPTPKPGSAAGSSDSSDSSEALPGAIPSASLDAISSPNAFPSQSKPPSPRTSAASAYKGQHDSGCDDLITSQLLKAVDAKAFVKSRDFHAEDFQVSASPWKKHPQLFLVGFCLIMIGIISAVSFFSTQGEHESLVADGIKAMKANKPDDAVVYFSAALKKSPNDGRAFFYRGLAYIGIDQPENALSDLNAAMVLNEPKARTLAARAAVNVQLHNYDAAIEDSTAAILADPKLPDAYKMRALAHSHKNDFEAAIKDCTTALGFVKDDETKGRLLRERGFAESKLNQDEAAIRDLTGSIQFSPNKFVYAQRAETYRHHQDWGLAGKDYGQAIALDPQTFNHYVGRGICYVKLSKDDDAMADFKQALKLSPNCVEALIQRGTLLLKNESWQEAADDFEKAARLNPNIAEPAQKLSVAYHHLKKAAPLQVAELESTANVKLPADMKSLMDLGYRYFQEGSYDEAILCFSEAVRRSPRDYQARRYLGHAFLQRGDYSDALAHFKALSTTRELDANDTLSMGQALAGAGQSEEAITVLTGLLERHPEILQAEAELARIYFRSGFQHKATQLLGDGLSKARTPSERKIFEQLSDSFNRGSADPAPAAAPDSHSHKPQSSG